MRRVDISSLTPSLRRSICVAGLPPNVAAERRREAPTAPAASWAAYSCPLSCPASNFSGVITRVRVGLGEFAGERESRSDSAQAEHRKVPEGRLPGVAFERVETGKHSQDHAAVDRVGVAEGFARGA